MAWGGSITHMRDKLCSFSFFWSSSSIDNRGIAPDSLHEGVQFSLAAEVNHAPGSYVYTMPMGVLYATWPTKHLVDLSRRYVSTKRVRRLFTEQLVAATLF